MFAAVPYVRQQISVALQAPRLIDINTVIAQVDEAPCADFAWYFTFYSPTTHTTPTDTLGTLGNVRLSLKLVNGVCAWAAEVQGVQPGMPYGGDNLDHYIDQGQLISVDAAVAAAVRKAGAVFTVASVFLDPMSDVIVTGSSTNPHYFLTGSLGQKAVSFRVDAVTGNVEAATGTTLD